MKQKQIKKTQNFHQTFLNYYNMSDLDFDGYNDDKPPKKKKTKSFSEHKKKDLSLD
jgi:hypothetical protein